MNATLDAHRLRAAIASIGGNQTSVARQSGVSRAQLGRLLAGNSAEVRRSTLERLARTLGTTPEALLVGGAMPQYKQWVAEGTAFIDFRGLGMPSLQRQPIAEVFVDPAVQEDPRGCPEECSPEDPRARSAAARPERSVPATKCVRDHDRLILLGNPGGGKTTLLRCLAHLAASRQEEDAETPILVRLPELCRAQELDEGVDLLKCFAARAAERGCPEIEELLRQQLAAGDRRCLVLLDGLDEVGNEEQRDCVVRSVHAFVEKYPRNRYVVTSRPAGLDATPWQKKGFSVFRILGYDQTRLSRFAQNWAGVLARTENKPEQEILDRLNRAIFANPRVRALASNPLIVTILALLNEARGGVLPRRRVDLCEKVADVFLDTWENNKRSAGGFEDSRSVDLDAREFRWLLSDLSLAMQRAQRTYAPRWWIAEKIEDYLHQKLGFALDEAKDACDRIIRYLAGRTGLLEERGLGLFAFSHRTLREYFASRGVIDEADTAPERGVTGCLRGYYFHPQWTEVVRLVAAQLTPPLAESLLSSILDDPDPVGRFLHRGQILALKCLSDGAWIANRRLIGGIFESLTEFGKSQWMMRVDPEVLEALDGFKGTRLEGAAKRTLEAIFDPDHHDLDEHDRAWSCVFARADRLSVPAVREELEKQLAEGTRSGGSLVACGWARGLAAKIGDDPALVETLKSWLDSSVDEAAAAVAARVLVAAMAKEEIAWDERAIARAEKLLMGLGDPCPCALESLEQLATARAVRRGLRFESVLRDALRPVADAIDLALVFGSTARNRQTQQSDIDLLIIGEATLKMLSGPLRQAETVLGRRISPAIYTRDWFRDRYQRGDPFLLDICRREKIPVLQKNGNNSLKDVEDELRTMVAERLAATP
jgi:predicted nucleotidyltransferase/transcriptional regulator with XRE-family HTH domain/energy-coupling factor transporter ATP-binding protein EcfA2